MGTRARIGTSAERRADAVRDVGPGTDKGPSKDQRKALAQLRNLPLTHDAAGRYADKSSVTVITSLDKDDGIILNTLQDPNHYDLFLGDPTPMAAKNVHQ